MRRKIGVLTVAVGVLFLVKPSFDPYEFADVFSYLCIRYWPVFLIVLGVYWQSKDKKKRRR